MIGYGGTGKAIALEALKLNIKLTIVTRTSIPSNQLYEKHTYVSANNFEKWLNLQCNSHRTFSIINSTDAGSLAKLEEVLMFLHSLLEADSIIKCFIDINHTPTVTSSIRLAQSYGISSYNGTNMNNNQAIAAFSFVHPEIDSESIRSAMIKLQP